MRLKSGNPTFESHIATVNVVDLENQSSIPASLQMGSDIIIRTDYGPKMRDVASDVSEVAIDPQEVRRKDRTPVYNTLQDFEGQRQNPTPVDQRDQFLLRCLQFFCDMGHFVDATESGA